MKKLIACLTLAAIASLSLQAGENCSDKSACAAKTQSACCASQTASACSGKAVKTVKKVTSEKGAQLLAKR